MATNICCLRNKNTSYKNFAAHKEDGGFYSNVTICCMTPVSMLVTDLRICLSASSQTFSQKYRNAKLSFQDKFSGY
jgi:hypothetical protein